MNVREVLGHWKAWYVRQLREAVRVDRPTGGRRGRQSGIVRGARRGLGGEGGRPENLPAMTTGNITRMNGAAR